VSVDFRHINLRYFVDIVKRDHPDWPLTAQYWQARRMLERHPFIQKAVFAGLDKGRELRERMDHGLGVWWDELEPLLPEERGFVLALVKDEIGVKGKDRTPLALVEQKRAEEAYEDQQDALAADWREKSNAADTRVKIVKSFKDLFRRGGAA
jgi:hypothetical protein